MTANARVFAEVAVVIALALGSLAVLGTNADLRADISAAMEDAATRIEATLGLKATGKQEQRAPSDAPGFFDWKLRGEENTSVSANEEEEVDFLARLRATINALWLRLRIMLGLNLGA